MSGADTNRTIAEAMGWRNFQERDRRVYGRPPERKTRNILTERQIPDYLHDANAATEMAEGLLPSGWCVRCNHEWDDLGGPYRVMLPGADPLWPSFFGRKLAPALCEAALAVLAERKDVTP